MKHLFTILLTLFSFYASGYAQKPFKVVFYNLENFFDLENDPDVLDDEFTPEGPKKWTKDKYDKKLSNIEKVFFDIAAINKDYPAVIGVCEIENRNVLEDIVATQSFRLPTTGLCIMTLRNYVEWTLHSCTDRMY